jgi:CDP-glucose 4,6-dehydratase
VGFGYGALEEMEVSAASNLSNEVLARTYRGARVLVTGHTGFKGAWLTMWLHDLGAKVTGLALEPDTKPSLFEAAAVSELCRHEVGDIRDYERVLGVVRETKPDFVFHLAAQALVRKSYAEPVSTIATNVLGTAHVLEAVRQAGIRSHVVVVTSDKCYENREWVHGYREADPMGGHDPYSMSKGAAELVTSSYRRSFFPPEKHAQHGVALGSARAGNVIGGGDWAADRLIPDIVMALSEGRVVGIRNPTAVRPWQHVLEPLGGYLLLGAHLQANPAKFSDAYNFGPSLVSSVTVREMVEAFVAAWGEGRWEDRSDPNAPHEAHLLRLSIDKAHAELGFVPRWDAATTIAATVDWYRTHARGAKATDLRAMTIAQIRAYASAD